MGVKEVGFFWVLFFSFSAARSGDLSIQKFINLHILLHLSIGLLRDYFKVNKNGKRTDTLPAVTSPWPRLILPKDAYCSETYRAAT